MLFMTPAFTYVGIKFITRGKSLVSLGVSRRRQDRVARLPSTQPGNFLGGNILREIFRGPVLEIPLISPKLNALIFGSAGGIPEIRRDCGPNDRERCNRDL